MKSVLLIGLGRFGMHALEKMNEFDIEIMAVDRNEARVNEILPMVTDAQIGDAANMTFLRSLGVDNFDLCLVAIGDDFQNSLVITAYLKELGARKVIARASSEIQQQFLLRNGADDVIYPEKQMAEWMVVRHAVDHVLNYIGLEGDLAIYEVTVPEEWFGKTVAALDIRRRFNLNILTIRSNGSSVQVDGNTVLNENDILLVVGKWEDVRKAFRI
ncbi:MAG: TrkA family potassium uptake protein [Clostridia bacterium]|jgi:trk system potassium uptake protein TrkA|nr:TrkA family potassium uptake protein [Clostridia bacterium]